MGNSASSYDSEDEGRADYKEVKAHSILFFSFLFALRMKSENRDRIVSESLKLSKEL